MHFVLYLPRNFYAGVAASLIEMIGAINEVSKKEVLTLEVIATGKSARSRSGLTIATQTRTSRKIDVLLLLAGAGAELQPDAGLLKKEYRQASPLIQQAQRNGAILAATCGASFFLAYAGLLDGKKATVSWWLKTLAADLFPKVKWDTARLLVRSGKLFTSGGGYAGFELMAALLKEKGFSKELLLARKLMVLPPARTSQSPYDLGEVTTLASTPSFLQELEKYLRTQLAQLSPPFLAARLHLSPRSLHRKFMAEAGMTPGKWIQQKRLEKARVLLETTTTPIDDVCMEVGYEDLSSFSRLFKKTVGLSPTEYRLLLR